MEWKILNTESRHFSEEAKSILLKIGSVDNKDLNQGELLKEIPFYNILIVRLGLLINKELIDAAPDLKYIVSATTGLDHIDVDYAVKKGMGVVSLKGEKEFLSSVTGTAELAFGLLLSLIRKIPWAFEAIKRDEWITNGEILRERYEGHELIDKSIGLIGFGRLGKLMAKYSKAFGMKVLAHDPYIDEKIFLDNGIIRLNFEELLRSSDIISLHIPLNNETENLISQKEFKMMKRDAYLINTSRGKIINEDDLLRALGDKIIAGAAVDVLSDELNFGTPQVKYCKLIDYSKNHDNLIIVPHIGGMTVEAAKKTRVFVVDKLKKIVDNL